MSMDYEDLECLASDDKVFIILDWAKTNPDFDTEFVEDMSETLEEYGELTGSQEDSLDNIIVKHRISREWLSKL